MLDSVRLSKTLVAVFLLVVASAGVTTGSDARDVVSEYFDMLQSGNLETAGYLWTEEDQERAGRFGISYEGIPFKPDCTSPVVLNLSERYGYLDPSVKSYKVLADGFAVVEYRMPAVDKDAIYKQYVHKLGDYYWLTYPQDYFARDWSMKQTRYFRIHYRSELETILHPVCLRELDRFVEATADSLDLDKKTLEMIAEKKIEYFYCDSDQTVEEITGQKTRGLVDLASNDIITASFPHYHELAHLLVNIKLRHLPLYTIPILREGIAVKYGGRWGKTSAALMDIGIYLYLEQLLEFDSVLSYRGFTTNASADISYPVAGLFSAWLAEELGDKDFYTLYRAASGGFKEISAMDAVDVQNLLISHTGHESWFDFRDDFAEYLKKRSSENLVTAPGKMDKGKEVITESGFKVRRDKRWFSFEFPGAGPEPPAGNLLFGYDAALLGQSSPLFEEHYGGQVVFEGYRFGVRFDQYEAGLYDYGTNQLLAKYIWGITPSADYYDEEANRVAIRFDRRLLDESLSGDVRCKLLPN